MAKTLCLVKRHQVDANVLNIFLSRLLTQRNSLIGIYFLYERIQLSRETELETLWETNQCYIKFIFILFSCRS